MAPEMIEMCKYSLKTDIFAFGVLIWEITTQEEPKVRKDARDNTRLWGQPMNTRTHIFPDYVVNLLPFCWKVNRKQRPTIAKIIEQLPQGKHG